MAKSTSSEQNDSPEQEPLEPPYWKMAEVGMKLWINNKQNEAIEMFLQHSENLVMFSAYSMVVFMDALMSLDEEKMSEAISVLKEVEKRCDSESVGWLKSLTGKVFGFSSETPCSRSLADQLEAQIILADSYLCLAILIFMQQDLSGYFKGGWVLRKAWKIYQRVYREIVKLYKENIGDFQLSDPVENNEGSTSSSCNELLVCDQVLANGYSRPISYSSRIPHSTSGNLRTENSRDRGNSLMRKSFSVNSRLSETPSFLNYKIRSFNSSLSYIPSLQLFASREHNIPPPDRSTICRLLGSVCFGRGLFQLGAALLPSSPAFRLGALLTGIEADAVNALASLRRASAAAGIRAPLAMLSMLWYHTIVRPFYAIDGTNIQAGVTTAQQLLEESREKYPDSALFLFFNGRVCRLTSDIPTALTYFSRSADRSTHREIRNLCLHEVGWCHLIGLEYREAASTFTYLRTASRWSRPFYGYLAAICSGSWQDIALSAVHSDIEAGLAKSQCGAHGAQLDEFLRRRSAACSLASDASTRLCCHLLVFEMLYLWNALASCSPINLTSIIEDCKQTSSNDEPFLGISHLILGNIYCIQKRQEDAIESFRKCLEVRNHTSSNSQGAHVSAFAQFELGAILVKDSQTKEEGKRLLENISRYSNYDFEARLNVRINSILKQHL